MRKILLSLAIFFASSGAAFASDYDFNSCLTPQGEIKASYESGTHGIIGLQSRVGKDVVYALQNDNAMQCFCSDDGSGVQTNWLNASTLSEEQIKIYENDGWMYVPSGIAWGLKDTSYLAKNFDYACKSTSNNSSSSIVQAEKGHLATTGNMGFVVGVFSVGLGMIVTGIVLRKNSK